MASMTISTGRSGGVGLPQAQELELADEGEVEEEQTILDPGRPISWQQVPGQPARTACSAPTLAST